VGRAGFELATSSVSGKRSPAELTAHTGPNGSRVLRIDLLVRRMEKNLLLRKRSSICDLGKMLPGASAWARSSVGEHPLHTRGVVGSIPTVPIRFAIKV
jgi:hypothetical protein